VRWCPSIVVAISSSPASKQRPPVAGRSGKRSEVGEPVLFTSDMRPGGGPAPILGPPGQPRPHRIELDVAHRRHQMGRIHRIGSEAALEEKAGPATGEVDPTRVAPVPFADRPAEPLRPGRGEDEVDVVRHQTPGQAAHVLTRAALRDQPPIGGIILVAEEDLLSAVAALGDMVRDVGNHDAREPGHEEASPGGAGASSDYPDRGLKYRVPGSATSKSGLTRRAIRTLLPASRGGKEHELGIVSPELPASGSCSGVPGFSNFEIGTDPAGDPPPAPALRGGKEHELGIVSPELRVPGIVGVPGIVASPGSGKYTGSLNNAIIDVRIT
jgi:hypothetical protein